VKKSDPVKYLVDNRSRTADELLSITDGIVKNSTRKLVRITYDKLRGSAKQHVEIAVPDFAKIIEKYTKS
jgi:hypothetical protein